LLSASTPFRLGTANVTKSSKMKTAIITSTKVKPRWRHMCEIYDLAAKSQCATQTWSVGVLERRKSDRRVASPNVALPKDRCAGKSVGRNTSRADLLHRSIFRRSFPHPGNELVEHRHACLCAQRAFSWLKGNRLQACLAHKLGSLYSAPPGQRAAKKWQPSDSVSKFDMLGL